MPREFPKREMEVKKKQLLEHLIRNAYLRDKRLIQAFMDIPLEDFIPQEYLDPIKLYMDIPNLFYYRDPDNYRTISAPHMISIMLQGLALKQNDDLLILGAKSGYIAALAHKLSPEGEIIVLEANSEIAKITMENLERLKLDGGISVIVKNPLEGMLELMPWQKILVTGAIDQDRIHPLLRQLDVNGGVLYAPIGEDLIQTYTQILRLDKNEFYGKKQLQVRFTPLMTQIELDEIELITDFEDIEEIKIKEDPDKVDEVLEGITIKYASSILEEIEPSINLKEEGKEEIDLQEKEFLLSVLNDVKQQIKKFKKLENTEACFDCIDEIEELLDQLKDFKKRFNIKLKMLQKTLNEINSFNLIRKELEGADVAQSDVIEKKIDIINKQMEKIIIFKEMIQKEIDQIELL